MSVSSSGPGARGLLRIVDANLNRIGEGLRVLEEVARLLLNDSSLTEQLKTLRHEMIRGDWPFHQRLLEVRDANGDVGIYAEVSGESQQREIPLMVMANARRVQESLRVLEEVAKLPDSLLELPSDRYKQARFALYSIEQRLLSRLNRLDKARCIAGLYVVIETGTLVGRSHAEVARVAVKRGARAIQLRDRLTGKRELLAIAGELGKLCRESSVLFIIHSHLDLVVATGADGLHLGVDDIPPEAARRILPLDRLLGVSVDTVEQAVAAESAGADYISIPVEKLMDIRRAVSVPVVATGDIAPDAITEMVAAGGSVAVPHDVVDVLGQLRSVVETRNG